MNGTGRRVHWGRAIFSGAVGGLVWCAALAVSFGPAQSLLGNPRWRHPKLLQVFGTLEPLPRPGDRARVSLPTRLTCYHIARMGYWVISMSGVSNVMPCTMA
jgi:hypothetical protein